MKAQGTESHALRQQVDKTMEEKLEVNLLMNFTVASPFGHLPC